MPGLSALRGSVTTDLADALFEAVEFRDSYDSQLAIDADGTIVGHSGYPSYPVERVETPSATVLLEGYLYDAADQQACLRELASRLADGDREGVAEWVRARDGDFLVLVDADWRDDLLLCNDAFGRLPTYYATVDDTVVVSRELTFVRELARRRGDGLELDPLATAQKLAFGYYLGDRTPFEDVRCLPPGSLAAVDEDGVAIDSLHEHDFEEKAHADKSVEENAANLASIFATACENRDLEDRPNVISLSGGLDSRAVAAAYADRGIPATTASFDFGGGDLDSDARVAQSIADELGLDWDLFRVAGTEAHRDLLLDTKQGVNYLGMDFILDFFEQLEERQPNATYVTGDGGDKVFKDLRPATQPGSTADLVDTVAEHETRFSFEEAAALAGVDRKELVDSVRRRLRSYPESDPEQLYVHFLIRERGINCFNHGEDRNRYFFWSVTPFYSAPVFRYAMNCPDDQKPFARLYTAFLEHFAPELAEIEYPNFGAPVTSLEYTAKRFAFDVLSRYPDLEELVLGAMRDETAQARDVATDVRSRLSEGVVDPLSKADVAAVANDYESYRPTQLNYLLTAVALAQDVSAESEQRAVARPQ